MSIKKALLMKLSFSIVLAIAFAITSCAQKQSKPDTAISKSAQTQKVKMSIDGMVCSACQSSVKKTIRGLDGVKDVEVSLENRNAIVTYYPNLINPDSIQRAVNKGGFAAGKPQQVKQ